jgi:hypothetical protein
MTKCCTASDCDIVRSHIHAYFNGDVVLFDWRGRAKDIQMRLDELEKQLATKDAELKACIESHRRQDLKCEALEERLSEKDRDA